MRFLVALLVLANLILYLLAHRLPEPEGLDTPTINLPRVTRIEMLDSGETEQPDPDEGENAGCFRVSGFLSAAGARNWLVLAGLPSERHSIVRDGLVERPVFALVHSGERPPPPLDGRGLSAVEPFSFPHRTSAGALKTRFLFPDSALGAASSTYRSENKRGFALESDRVSFYSYALEGREQLRDAWSRQFPDGNSGKLEAESCESIAKQQQNP